MKLYLIIGAITTKENPDLSISYVSSAVGFSYQSYFSTLFCEKYGIPPTDMQKLYREELKNIENQEAVKKEVKE